MIGRRLDHYLIQERLGAGGMGEVFLALDTKLDRKVALKVLPSAMAVSETRLQRFRREARTLASLNHLNIVTIYSVETVDDVQFLTMELLDGTTLTKSIPREGMPVADFFDVAIQLTDALAAAHTAGVIHRDLKPGNVMVTRDGVVKVVDFGLAKLARPDSAVGSREDTMELLTGEGKVLGTVPYMSPEQLTGRSVDHRSDIFSLGIVLYEMATGERPFKGATSAELHSSILRDTPRSVHDIKPELPHHVARLIRLCLAKDPEDRLQSAKDVRNELHALRQEISIGSSAPEAAAEPPRRLSRLARYFPAIVMTLVAGYALWQLTGGGPPGGSPAVGIEAQALLDQAELYELRGSTLENLAAAEERYRRALQLEPDNAAIRGRLARFLTEVQANYPEADRPESVRELAESALELDPQNTDAWLALGYLALSRNELGAAEEAARKVMRLAPESPFGYILRGRVHVRAGETDLGLEMLRQGVERGGTDLRPRLALAWALWHNLGRGNEAAVEYEQVLRYAPNSPSALNNLGSIYGQQGRYLDAIPLFRRLLNLTEDPEAAFNLGNCYFFLDRLEEAIEAYLRVLEIDPDNVWAPHGLAEAYEKLGDTERSRPFFERALRNYDRALSASGPNARFLGSRAVCAGKLGRHTEAIDAIHEAEQLAPRSGVVLFNAAQVYALAGDRAKSYEYIRRAIESGYPRQEFENDLVFADHVDDPEFRRILEAEVGS